MVTHSAQWDQVLIYQYTFIAEDISQNMIAQKTCISNVTGPPMKHNFYLSTDLLSDLSTTRKRLMLTLTSLKFVMKMRYLHRCQSLGAERTKTLGSMWRLYNIRLEVSHSSLRWGWGRIRSESCDSQDRLHFLQQNNWNIYINVVWF